MSDYTSISQDYERESKADYSQTQQGRRFRSSRPHYRTKSRPVGHNGMHRRRQKRWSW